MSFGTAFIIFLTGIVAGMVNAVAGGGSLVTFPVLLALGYPPVLANVSNNIGLTPGTFSSVMIYRRELEGQRKTFFLLGPASIVGSVTGALLLLALPESVFKAAVPPLIALASVLLALQPRIRKWVVRKNHPDLHHKIILVIGVYLTGIYGGYFGAAQGVILITLLAIVLGESMQRVNAMKNLLALAINAIASVYFIVFTNISWSIVLLVSIGTAVGSQIGARYGRKLPDATLRRCIVVVGIAIAIYLGVIWR